MVSIRVACSSIISSKLVVDFTKLPWSALNYHNLCPFHTKEAKRICSAYKDGLFPGAVSVSVDEQMSQVKRFANYLQFLSITADEVKEREGKLYLTTKFFRKRHEGWLSPEEVIKEGKIVGYFVNGYVYHPNDLAVVHELIFRNVYYRLIEKLPEFNQLLTYLRTNYELELIGLDEPFMQKFQILLLEKAKE